MINTLKELLDARTPVEDYARAAELQREVSREIMARLDWMTLQPNTIVNVGSATGEMIAALQTRYPNAECIAVDASSDMIAYATKHTTHIAYHCAPPHALPLATHSVDLLVANLVLPWCEELTTLMTEWHRVLRPEGLLMITSLGPDTLRELHDAPCAFPHVMDMHTLGDLLVQSGFASPVLDVDYVTMRYQNAAKLWHELQVTGMIAGDVSGVKLTEYAMTYEIIFAHAWRGGVKQKGEVRIPVSQISKR